MMYKLYEPRFGRDESGCSSAFEIKSSGGLKKERQRVIERERREKLFEVFDINLLLRIKKRIGSMEYRMGEKKGKRDRG